MIVDEILTFYLNFYLPWASFYRDTLLIYFYGGNWLDHTFGLSFHSFNKVFLNRHVDILGFMGGSAVICHLSILGFRDCRGVPLTSNIHTPSYFLSQGSCCSLMRGLWLTHHWLTLMRPHSMEIHGVFFSRRGLGLWACMCAIIELNSNMTERARKSKLLPGGLFRWKAAVYRWQTCYEPHHTYNSSYIQISSSHCVLLQWIKLQYKNRSYLLACIVKLTVKTCKTVHKTLKMC